MISNSIAITSRTLFAPGAGPCSWSEPKCLSRSALRPVFAPPGTRWQSRKRRGPAFLLSRVESRAPKPARAKPWVPPADATEIVPDLRYRGAPTACGRSPPPSRIEATESTPTATPWAPPTPAGGCLPPDPPRGFLTQGMTHATETAPLPRDSSRLPFPNAVPTQTESRRSHIERKKRETGRGAAYRQ